MRAEAGVDKSLVLRGASIILGARAAWKTDGGHTDYLSPVCTDLFFVSKRATTTMMMRRTIASLAAAMTWLLVRCQHDDVLSRIEVATKLDEWEVLGMGPRTIDNLRGGDSLQDKIQKLGIKFGPDFLNAIEQNKKDHAADCALSCQMYYCAPPGTALKPLSTILNQTRIASYSMGAVPPEDFANDFGFPLDLIKVTQGKPLFSHSEAANVIATAQKEGVDKNEYISGKYKLGGTFIVC